MWLQLTAKAYEGCTELPGVIRLSMESVKAAIAKLEKANPRNETRIQELRQELARLHVEMLIAQEF